MDIFGDVYGAFETAADDAKSLLLMKVYLKSGLML